MKEFNTSVVCIPGRHYMVDTSEMIQTIIERYVLKDRYFVINRARQYGKTTTLARLKEELKGSYYVIKLSFEGMQDAFSFGGDLARALQNEIAEQLEIVMAEKDIVKEWKLPISDDMPLYEFGRRITKLCKASDKEIVLMIDEVDSASNNELFLEFLGLLRKKYISRAEGEDYTFKSVILAGVYDIKNLKLKMRQDMEHRYNSPWNVAVNFNVDMGLPKNGIVKMLEEYRADYGLSFDAEWFGQQIFDYTSGYPFLVSRICELLDTEVLYEEAFSGREKAWTPEGLRRAVKLLVKEHNTLFDDLNKKMEENQELKQLLYQMVVCRKIVSFNIHDNLIQLGHMFGWLVERDGRAVVSNRIFETVICDKLIQEQMNTEMFQRGAEEQYQMKTDTELNMDAIVRRFAAHFRSLYIDRTVAFLENEARMLFLTFLKPIINGTGNYYQESQLTDNTRTDVVIDYYGRQYIVELKIWHGESYEQSGREQLCSYLEKYNLPKGWLVSFCFNKNKEAVTGEKVIEMSGKTIVEMVV